MARVVVYGATGNIGQRIVAEALARGHDVIAAVRTPSKVTQTSERLSVVTTDPTDPAAVTAAVRGADAVIASLAGDPDFYAAASHAVLDGVRDLVDSQVPPAGDSGPGGPLLLWVGGAGSLCLPDGTAVIDSGRIPAAFVPVVAAQVDVLDLFRSVRDVRWTYLSPAELIEPGARQPGGHRLGDDDLVQDDAGVSRITYDDFAAAVLDEVEEPAHVGRRFTLGY